MRTYTYGRCPRCRKDSLIWDTRFTYYCPSCFHSQRVPPPPSWLVWTGIILTVMVTITGVAVLLTQLFGR